MTNWYDAWPALAPEIQRMDAEQLRTACGATAPPPAYSRGECPQCSVMAVSLKAEIESGRRLNERNERLVDRCLWLEAENEHLKRPVAVQGFVTD